MRFYWPDVSECIVEPEPVKLDNTATDERPFGLSFLRVLFRRHTHSEPHWVLRSQASPPTEGHRLAPRVTLLSSCLRGQMPAHAVGTLAAHHGPRPTCPAQAFFVDRTLCTSVWLGQRYLAPGPLAVRSRSIGPNGRRRVAGPDSKEDETTIAGRPCGPE